MENLKNKIKEKLKCIPDDAKHLWENHKTVCIVGGVIVIIAIIII